MVINIKLTYKNTVGQWSIFSSYRTYDKNIIFWNKGNRENIYQFFDGNTVTFSKHATIWTKTGDCKIREHHHYYVMTMQTYPLLAKDAAHTTSENK